MNNVQFEFSRILDKAAGLKSDLQTALNGATDEKVCQLAEALPSFASPATPGTSDAPLSVALIGQYDSGKSTIISALTQRRDIPIDADVCTDTVTAYDWSGIRILDTPGIHAGYADHDAATYMAIDNADLLVFVITNELFDDIIGKHFRDLCFTRNKAPETLLVVNKMGQDPGTPAIKLPDIARVTTPSTPGDFRTSFIDALTYMEANDETDPVDRAELMEIANFETFVQALNSFVREKGLMGRLTTPLFELRAIAAQAEAFLAVDMPEERAAIELLNRKRGLLLGSRSRLQGAFNGLLCSAVSDLIAIGDAVAESVEPGVSEADVQARHEAAQNEMRGRSEKLASDVETAVIDELQELRRQLKTLENGALAQELKRQVIDLNQTGKGVSRAADWQSDTEAPSELPRRSKKLAEVSKDLGKFAIQWANGPLAETVKAGTSAAAKGSQAHVAVYKVGKFFGVQFKPWGAVKIARIIGNAGRVIAAIGGVLAVVSQVIEDKQLDDYRTRLREARDSLRSEYRQYAREIEQAFRVRFEDFCKDFYDSEIAAVDDMLSGLVDGRSARGKSANEISRIAGMATVLISDIQDQQVV